MSKKIISNRYSTINDSEEDSDGNGNQPTAKSDLNMKAATNKNTNSMKSQQNLSGNAINMNTFFNVQDINNLRDKFRTFVNNEVEKKSNGLKQDFLQRHQQKANELQNEMATIADKIQKQNATLLTSYFEQKEFYEKWQKSFNEQKQITESHMKQLKNLLQNNKE